MDTCIVFFPVFLSVNVIGTVLGYEASRIRRIREWGTIKTWRILGFILGIVFVGVGYWLSSIPFTTKSGEMFYGFGRGPYGVNGVALFFFGIIVLAIIIGKILWLKILERPMNTPSFEYKLQPRRNKP